MGGGPGPGDALLASWIRLVAAIDGAWSRTSGRTIAAVTGVPVAGMNGVWSVDGQVSEAEVDDLLGAVAACGVPYGLQVPATQRSRFDALAAARGLQPDEDVPMMRVDVLGDVPRPPAGVVIRPLGPDEVGLHQQTAAAGFGAPPEVFEQLVPQSVLELDGVRAYVAEEKGEVCCTGLGIQDAGALGIFNVATPAEHRRRGLGAALTAAIVADGLAEGAGGAWLQSTALGYGVYESLGFTTVEVWSTWEATDDR